MHPTLALLTAAAVAIAAPLDAPPRENKLSDAAKAILDKAESVEIFSLDPARPDQKPKDDFHGWKVLGSTAVKDKDARKKAIDGVCKGIAESDGTAARCFNPRHGLRAKHDGKTVDLVICFECYRIQVFVNGERDTGVLTAKTGEPPLDEILKDAKVPLAPKPK